MHQAALSLPSSVGGRQGERKMGMEFVGQDKGSLIKQKQGCTWEQRKTKYLLSTFDQREMSGHFLGSTASVHRAAAPQD